MFSNTPPQPHIAILEDKTSNPSIEVGNLSKCYNVYAKPSDRLKQFIVPRIFNFLFKKEKKYFSEFWALSGISFTVNPGETVGIIGKNGSGKSTLLQIICGTLTPTAGTVETRGRIAALLELGSGFNPEFTGRENIFLNGSILGLEKAEIEKKLQKIIDFADIGSFIDQPIKTYSSGMTVRLAFAVQSQIDPEILIVDEALAVGDAKFQAKCFDRLKELKNNGTSILLVTHSSEQIVTHCDKAILIHEGRQIVYGNPKSVVNKYHDILFGKELIKIDSSLEPLDENKSNHPVSVNKDIFSTHPNYNKYEYRWGDQAANILDFLLSANNIDYPQRIKHGEKINLTFSVRFLKTLINPIFGVTIKTKEGITIYGTNSELQSNNYARESGHQGTVAIIIAEFECNLSEGDYFISLGVATRNGAEIIPHDRRYDSIHIYVEPSSNFFGITNVKLEMSVRGGSND